MALTKVSYSMITGAVVNVLDYGAKGDGATNDTVAVQNAWNALAAKGGGTLYFPAGTYLINLVGKGSDYISIVGEGANSVLCSYAVNDWAVKYDTGYLSNAESIRDIVFQDVKGTKSRHGLYVNCASGLPLYNVVFKNNGIGYCANGSYGSSFYYCNFYNNYIGCFFTCSTGANTSITNINGQTVQITDAFFPQHPGLDSWHDGNMSGDLLVYYEQPNNPYQYESNLSFNKVVFVPINGSGVYIRQGGSFQSITFNKCWFEGAGFSTVPVRSYSAPAKFAYSDSSNLIFNGCGYVYEVEIGGTANCYLNESILGDGYTKTGVSSFYASNCQADDRSMDFYVKNPKQISPGREIICLTPAMVLDSYAYSEYKKYSNKCIAAAPAGWSLDAADGIFSTLGCFQTTVASSASNNINGTFLTVTDKVYVTIVSIKSTAGTLEGYINSAAGAGPVILSTKWKTYAIVGTSSSGSRYYFLYVNTSAGSQTIKVCGLQVLEFDDYDLAYQFLASNTFNL